MKSYPKADFASQLIANNANRCVWMELGMVSYKICDRNFECQTCPLDYGLRGTNPASIVDCAEHEQLTSENSGKEPITLAKKQETSWQHLLKFKLEQNYHIHPGHTWIKEIGPRRVRIGIDDMIATTLGTIDEVVLPLPGDKIVRGGSCGQIIQFEHIFSIVSPLTGRVVLVNQEIANFPDKMVLAPLTQGWLLDVEPENLAQDLKFCRSGDTLVPWYLKEYKWLECNLAEGFQQPAANVGITMADGGEISRNLRNYLPKERYRRLVLNLLGKPEYNT
jgi:glycine cleavage system H protein